MNTTCDQCGQVNPADIHTCTPKRPQNCGTGHCSCVECVMEPAAQPILCAWTKSNDPNMPDTFDSNCGVVWTFTDGGPGENNVRFCPGCGGKLVEGQS